MMTKMREFSKGFIILVALSFIGLMVVQWGADYTGRSKRNDMVGKVNGHKLTYAMFSKLYQQMYQEERARKGNGEFTDEDLQRMRDQVWERFIQQTLLKEEMDRLGISVSDSEIVYQIYNYPLDDFKRHPAFQTNGVFDMAKYRASFSNPNIPWRQVEAIYRQQIPYLKLQNMITSTVRISDMELLDAYKKQNLKVKVDYLGILANDFYKSDTPVTEEELQKYYDDHKEDFKQKEKRQLSFVLFPIRTTKQDTARVLEEFQNIKKRLAAGENFNDLAKEYSDDPSVKKNNGKLGYFDRTSMVRPFADAAFSAKVGEIVGPVQTSFGFHLIKVEDRKMEKGKLKVKASHILMKVTPAPSRVENTESQARLFSEDAKDNGFTVMAQKDSLKIQKTGWFEERSGFIPGIGQNLAINNWAFTSKVNDVSGVYRLDKGYVVVSLTEIQPEGYKSLESQKRFIENRIRFLKSKDVAHAFAKGLEPKVKKAGSLKSVADQDKSGKIRYEVTPQFPIMGSVPGVGYDVAFNATAFSLKPNEISGLVEGDRGFYYEHLLEKTPFDSTAFNAQKEVLRRQLLTQKRNKIFMDWYNHLKQKADIVDNRKMFNL